MRFFMGDKQYDSVEHFIKSGDISKFDVTPGQLSKHEFFWKMFEKALQGRSESTSKGLTHNGI